MFYWILKTLFSPLIKLIWIKKVKGNEHYGKENDEKILREITNKIMLRIAELSGKEYKYL